MSAVTPPAVVAAEEPQSKVAPDKNPCERLFSNGMIRVSSSRRGKAFAVAYKRVLKSALTMRVDVKPPAHAAILSGTR